MKLYTFLFVLTCASSLAAQGQVTEAWVRHYVGGDSSGLGKAIGIDKDNNVYVTGQAYFSPYNSEIVTIKYNPEGVEEWISSYSLGEVGYAYPVGVLTVYPADGVSDSEFTTYVAGAGNATEFQFELDYLLIKYDETGSKLWNVHYNGPGNKMDDAFAIAIDSKGCIYMTGRSWSDESGFDYATVKYDPYGKQLWVARFTGPETNDWAAATDIAVDDAGNVFITGSTQHPDSDFDFVTIKYDKDGKEQWVRRHADPGNIIDFAQKLVLSKSGNIYVTGLSKRKSNTSAASNDDFVTIKYNTNGQVLWTKSFDGNSWDIPRDMVIDSNENLYITGYSFSETRYDYLTVKYDSDGNEKWVSRYNGPGNGNDLVRAISIDSIGNVYIVGSSLGASSHFDIATVKYDSQGIEQWIARYSVPINQGEEPTDIIVDRLGNVYVTGTSSFGITTIKYVQDNAVLVEDKEASLPKNYILFQNFPNPFNPSTMIKYFIPKPSYVEIKVFDTLGREVQTLINEFKQSGSYETIFNGTDLSSGIYFYRLRAGGFEETKKFILMQ